MVKDFATVFLEHWYVMFPIAACSVAGVVIAVERALTLRAAGSIDKDEFLNFIGSHCMQGQVAAAIDAVAQTKGPLPGIVRAGLVTIANGQGAEDVQTAMDAAALREIPRLSRRIDLLSTLANIAVLLGLLGTISAMISAFGAVAQMPSAEKTKALTAAIAGALNATGFGLVVAIVLFGAWGLLQSWSTRVVDDVHEASVATLNFILANKDKVFKGQ